MTNENRPIPDDPVGLPLPLSDRAGSKGSGRPSLPTITSEALLQGGREIQICHGDDTYVLRITRNGKLILTK